MKFKYLKVLAIVVIVIGFVFYFKQKTRADVVQVSFQTATAELGDVEETALATGRIVPRNEVEIKSLVSGVVRAVQVKAGDKVSVGSVVTALKLTPNAEALSDAESDIRRIEIELDKTKKEFGRQDQLFKQGIISNSTHDTQLASRRILEEELKRSKEKVELMKYGQSKNFSASPGLVASTVEGMVLDVLVQPGDYVTETNTFTDGTTIAYIADMQDLIFKGTIDESEVGKLRPGMSVVIDVAAIKNMKFTAELEFISPKGFWENGAMKFEIKAKVNPTSEFFLRSGYSATALIVLDAKNDVVILEESYIGFKNDIPFVDVVNKNGEVSRRDIKVGISDGLNIEITAGLIKGEKVRSILN